jgi:hypothetical protein
MTELESAVTASGIAVDTIEEIVSGGAKGADTLGEQFAQTHNLPCKIFPADWKKYGRAAGPKRNAQMAEYANYGVALWDGKSRGTANMIKRMDGRVFVWTIPTDKTE